MDSQSIKFLSKLSRSSNLNHTKIWLTRCVGMWWPTVKAFEFLCFKFVVMNTQSNLRCKHNEKNYCAWNLLLCFYKFWFFWVCCNEHINEALSIMGWLWWKHKCYGFIGRRMARPSIFRYWFWNPSSSIWFSKTLTSSPCYTSVSWRYCFLKVLPRLVHGFDIAIIEFHFCFTRLWLRVLCDFISRMKHIWLKTCQHFL